MDKTQTVAAWITVAFAIPGVVGGWFAMVEKIKEWRRSRFPPGLRGVNVYGVSRETRSNGETVCGVLAAGDLLQIMKPLVEPPLTGRLELLEYVGEYYHVKVAFPPGVDPNLIRTIKNVPK